MRSRNANHFNSRSKARRTATVGKRTAYPATKYPSECRSVIARGLTWFSPGKNHREEKGPKTDRNRNLLRNRGVD